MGICEPELVGLIIRPTLRQMGLYTKRAEQLLLQAAAASELGHHICPDRARRLGLYRITSKQHRQVWDTYLVHQPELASTVRGLASQRAFLNNPDDELITNLRYATAIAWLLIQQTCERMPSAKPTDAELLATAFNRRKRMAA
ncbi:hypothetical protein L1F30_07780 [Simiduia sp. 21SJ11W-1]|uniref:hypothetical protein n=1 Tax=Simiduia sp. 21SJ11W-1 TaxID=2909669 RepID=UPI00209E77AB|nr:hypothetical protein [Simiduia sp. 21SJ11W-1]UTA49427.1 hypothetical protein L1F30_07780 [Simiduia sp. 21SJ11W-1]